MGREEEQEKEGREKEGGEMVDKRYSRLSYSCFKLLIWVWSCWIE